EKIHGNGRSDLSSLACLCQAEKLTSHFDWNASPNQGKKDTIITDLIQYNTGVELTHLTGNKSFFLQVEELKYTQPK
ncbi:MAG: hypothetical protein OEY25_12135, partial [Candidatus Aminicenantes bacterium]|nr:hypothetical protein [Candidatus Aminicenantes bacterium]